MSARHSASGGGRSVREIAAQLAGGPVTQAGVVSSRSVFAVAAAAAAGAGAASVTGVFPAIHAPTLPGLGDSHAVSQIIEPAAASMPLAAPVAAHPSAVRSFPRSALAPSRSTGAPGGTVMATGLHHSGASQIAALARAVPFNRSAPATAVTAASAPAKAVSDSARTVTGAVSTVTGAVSAVAGAAGSVVSSALALPSRIGGVPLSGTAGSKSAAIAVKNAATKLGRPYVWGAKGPNAFDCSGLMQWAYKQAGVKIPPNSSAQAKAGTPVSIKDLKPGDMVFYYTPVSHVGMYIGNGKILHASEPGKPVKISPVGAFPIHNARRVTG